MQQTITRRSFLKSSTAATTAAIAGGAAAQSGVLFEDTVPLRRQAIRTKGNRGSSGSIVALKDGSLLFACGNPGDELQTSGILGSISKDGGRTCSAPYSMQRNYAKDETVQPSLLRLKDESLLFAYNVQNNYQGPDIRRYDGHIYVRRSKDEGKTWEDQFCATIYPGCHTTNPDHLIQLSSGRVVLPAEWTMEVGGGEIGHAVCLCYYCDDGYTWIRSKNWVDTGKTTEEPSIVELKDGRLLMIYRTVLGYVGKAYSEDAGDTWTDAGLYDLPSPLAPQTITRIPSTGDLLLLWLNNPSAPAFAKGEKQPMVKVGPWQMPRGRVRAPLTSAITVRK